MKTTNNYYIKSGISITTLLTIIFVILKWSKAITWSWWWVLSPLWITAGIAIITIIVILLVMLVLFIIELFE